jgi:hypothetical protein
LDNFKEFGPNDFDDFEFSGKFGDVEDSVSSLSEEDIMHLTNEASESSLNGYTRIRRHQNAALMPAGTHIMDKAKQLQMLESSDNGRESRTEKVLNNHLSEMTMMQQREVNLRKREEDKLQEMMRIRQKEKGMSQIGVPAFHKRADRGGAASTSSGDAGRGHAIAAYNPVNVSYT